MKHAIPILKTERLLLRPIAPLDLEAMYDYTSRENVARCDVAGPYKFRGY